MIECGNLITVNDLYGPPCHIWNVEPCHSQWLLCSPILYNECGNLITVNNSYGPSIPYMVCGKPCNGVSHIYNMIWMWDPCNCQWLMVPNTLIGMWELSMTHMVPLTLFEMCEPCNCKWLMVPPYLILNVGTFYWGPPHLQYDLNVGTL